MAERIIHMQTFLRALVAGVLPSLLRLIAASIEGYLEGLNGTVEGGEK